MGIKIGKNAKIGDYTAIGDNAKVEINKNNSKNALIIGIVGSVISGLILMFSFWDKIIEYIESIFG